MLGILVALLCAFSLVMGICGSNTAELSKAAIGSCSDAVQLAVYLAGSMALWGGLMKIAQEAGITKAFERVLSPVTRRLFAGCSDEAMKSISVNITANLLGLGNAATPAAGDRITVLDMAGMQTIYFRNTANTKWGCNVRKKVKGVMRTVWTEGGTIPSGTGFWYMRTDEGTLKVRFESVK